MPYRSLPLIRMALARASLWPLGFSVRLAEQKAVFQHPRAGAAQRASDSRDAYSEATLYRGFMSVTELAGLKRLPFRVPSKGPAITLPAVSTSS